MSIPRLLLAVAVILNHGGGFMGIYMTNGIASVQAFYIISGFYMALLLSTKYTGRGGVGRFYINRFLKIFPIHWAVIILGMIFHAILSLSRGRSAATMLGAYSNPIAVTGAPLTAIIVSAVAGDRA